MVRFTDIKNVVGKRVNIKLTSGEVIVNVLIESFVYSTENSYIVIKYDEKTENIPLNKIESFSVVEIL